MDLEYVNDKYKTLKDVLKKEFNISDRLILKLKETNSLYINNINAKINDLISINDIIKINLDFSEDTNNNIISVKMPLDIIFEDESILVINKPSNMPIHPSILHFEDTLSNGIKYYFNSIGLNKKIRPVNRLDKDTTGIVIFAKNQYIQETLIRHMQNNTFKKEYIAILKGHLENSAGTINANISRKDGSIIEREINENGDTAVTHYELIKNFEYEGQKLSLVKFILETGRTHQIRVHSKYIGHPIIGDSLYGIVSNLIERQALHAFKVTFIHPLTNKQLVIEAPIPNDMEKIIKES